MDFIFVPTLTLKTAGIDIYTPSTLSLLQTPRSSDSNPQISTEKLENTGRSFFWKSALLFAAADTLLVFGLFSGFTHPLDFPLIRWTAGAVLLGSPTSLAIDHLAKTYNFRSAFLVEAGLTVFAFGWLCSGFVVLGNSPAVDAAPLLWWPAFAQSVLGLSVMGTAAFCLVSTSVLTLALGAAEQQQ